MTTEVFQHLKAHKETAGFIAEIGAIICKRTICTKCPMVLDVKLDNDGITSGCACALLCVENMSQHDKEIAKTVTAIIDLFN